MYQLSTREGQVAGSRRDFLSTSAAALAGGLGFATSARAKRNGPVALRIGLAKGCTTPEDPIWLHGYAGKSRFRPFEGKLNDLYAKAMAIDDAEGHRAVLITIDQCVLRAREAKALFERITGRTGLARGQVLLNFSHTHSGPLIGVSDLNRYPMPDEIRKRTEQYTAKLMDQLADVAAAALADLKPARLSWGVGQADFVMNRRTYDESGAYRGMGPNPDKYADRNVPVLRVDEPDGKMRAVLFGCACHAVTLTSDNIKLSGDYPSFAQESIEKRHPGVQAMFVQGCGADANSHPRGGPEQEQIVRRQGESLAAEVSRGAGGKLQLVRGPLPVEFAEVDLPLEPVPSRECLQKMGGAQAYNARRMLAALDRNESLPTCHTAPLAVWQFGEDLTLVGISCETVSAYVPLVEKALGPGRLWIAGYSNEIDGYLPDAAIVAEGGYEARGLVADIGFYSAKAQDVVVDTVRRLAQEAGRRLP
ncbi:MAG: neutral/alkaline non-lysosomal ceramidase N-terminal domain-containing protein [Planctomycetota bacterium]